MKTVLEFDHFKKSQKKITMLTCYDFWTAKLLNDTDVDCLLVGDSVSMVVHGATTPVEATMEMMTMHTRAVRRGAPNKLIVADMPFLSYRKSLKDSIENAGQLVQSGAQAVKLEGAMGNERVVRSLVQSGIPVMGHLGLTPQSVHAMGGFRVQGKSQSQAEQIKKEALLLQDWGVFSLVLECVPSALGREVTESLEIPTIGIGAGVDTSGQVLVLQDMLGAEEEFRPHFLRQFGDIKSVIKNAVQDFNREVKAQTFPSIKESYE